MKCWEDVRGETVCGDSVPPSAIPRGFREYDKRGIERRRLDRVPTKEEREKQQKLEELRKQQDRLRSEQEEYDRRLFDIYPSLDDLLMSRDRKIARLDDQIEIAEDEIRRLAIRLSGLQSIAAQAERQGAQSPAALRADMAKTKRAVEAQRTFIRGKKEEKKTLIEQFDFDLKRYLQLRPNEQLRPES